MKTGVLIGGSLFAIVLAIAMQLGGRIKLSDKKHFLYLFGFSLALSLTGFIALIKQMEISDRVLLLQLLFLVLGIVHVWFLDQLTGVEDRLNTVQALLTTFFIAITGAIFFIFVYGWMEAGFKRLKPGEFATLLGLASLSFTLPMIMFRTAEAYLAIPEAIHKSWRYPGDDYYPNLRFQQYIPFRISLFVKLDDTNRRTYKIRTMPVESTFGDIFFQFLFENQQREKPEKQIDIYFREPDAPEIQWSFKIVAQLNNPTTWFRHNRFLDPDNNLIVNKLRPNDLIVATRVYIKRAS